MPRAPGHRSGARHKRTTHNGLVPNMKSIAMRYAQRYAKRITTIGRIPLVLVLSLTMCKEDVLNLQPLGTLTDQTFYNTTKDFDAATLGPYSTMLNLTYDQGGRGWFNGIL